MRPRFRPFPTTSTTWPYSYTTICTKHRDYPRLLDELSQQTNRQSFLRPSTAPTFNTQQRVHCRDTTTAILHPYTFRVRFACREEENLVFCFGALFNSTLNFTQSGWHILFSPDLRFRLAKRVSGQTHSIQLETATGAVVSLVVLA